MARKHMLIPSLYRIGRAMMLGFIDQGLHITCAIAFRLDTVFAYLEEGKLDMRKGKGSMRTGFSSPHLILLLRHASTESVDGI